MIETLNGVTAATEQSPQDTQKVVEKIFSAAQPSAVFAPPVVSGAYTVITASEVFAGGGFGFGPASQGGGGGGASHGRPIAAILIGPDGVKVQPVVDATKIAVTMMTAWAGVAVMAVRLARASKRGKLPTK